MTRRRQKGEVVLTIALALLSAPLPAAAEGPAEIGIGFANGNYENLDADLEPIRQGSLTIRVSSPRHRLTVHGNRLTLAPRGDGTLDAAIEIDFEGHGDLIADVERVGRFEDRVAAPRQSARAAGVVRLSRAGGNYVFTVVSADPSARLTIASGIASQVVGACRAFSIFLRLPCGGLEQALSVVDVPMPGPGEQLVLRADLLSGGEKAFLDRFVSAE